MLPCLHPKKYTSPANYRISGDFEKRFFREAAMHVMRLIFFLFLGVFSQWAFATLPIQHWQSPSGARVYFIESRDLPILDISVDFSAGSSTDTRDKSGRAGMTLHLLDLGAAVERDQIAKALADSASVQAI